MTRGGVVSVRGGGSLVQSDHCVYYLQGHWPGGQCRVGDWAGRERPHAALRPGATATQGRSADGGSLGIGYE